MTDITYRRPIAWESVALTHTGAVRTLNEDAVLNKPQIGLWAVADGMGGHKFGDVASAKIVSALDSLENCDRLSDVVDIVESCLLDLNQTMLEYANEHLDGHTMGSTLVCSLVRGRIGACLWVGDSRLYRYRNGQLEQLSRDHSQIEEMVELGLITPEQAVSHPSRNVITRAIGVDRPLLVDLTLFSTQVGDTFLLCSDGLYNALDEPELCTGLSIKNIDNAANYLMSESLSNQAKDNVSLVIIRGTQGRVPSGAN